jgi:hypothetical protein
MPLKRKFTITHNKEIPIFFADYRLGIRFIMVGTKLAAGDQEHSKFKSMV